MTNVFVLFLLVCLWVIFGLSLFCFVGVVDTLSQKSAGWNVSLFHYRYHGADIGRVLVGVQVMEKHMESWNSFLCDLGYSYHHENSNRVYRQFLK